MRDHELDYKELLGGLALVSLVTDCAVYIQKIGDKRVVRSRVPKCWIEPCVQESYKVSHSINEVQCVDILLRPPTLLRVYCHQSRVTRCQSDITPRRFCLLSSQVPKATSNAIRPPQRVCRSRSHPANRIASVYKASVIVSPEQSPGLL